jgi:diguanylate cyclase (GGDEF)-like protein
VWRRRFERAARTAYATDLATGLPHQAQLVEHMTQLLALREREPAPMVLIVLRVDGFASAATRLGAEAGNILRRKVAVRLRSLLRASDVVAAIGPDAFGVLLGRLEVHTDGERVAAKLVRALQQPTTVAGQPCRVVAACGAGAVPRTRQGRRIAAAARQRAGRLGGHVGQRRFCHGHATWRVTRPTTRPTSRALAPCRAVPRRGALSAGCPPGTGT